MAAAVVIGIAVLLRLAYAVVYPDAVPYARYPVADAALYLRWADVIAAGDWLSQGEGVFYRAPLYPYLLAIGSMLGSGWLVWTLAQMALGLGTLYLVGRLAVRAGGPWAGVIAAGALAWHGPLLAFESKALPTSLGLFLHVAFLWMAVATADRPSRARALACGLLLGLGALVRPTWLVFLPAAPLLLQRFIARGRRRALGVAFLAGACLVVLPVTVRNRVVGGEWVLVSSNGGLTFFQGNNEENRSGLLGMSSRLELFGSAEDQRGAELRSAERLLGRPLSPAESSRFWFGQGLAFVTGRPLAWLGLELRKAYRFALSFEYADNYSFGLERARVWPLRIAGVPFGALLGLGLAGLVLARRALFSGASGTMIVASAALACGTSLAFYVSSRYRIEIVPALGVLAGVAGASVLTGSASRARAFAALSLAALVLAASFLSAGAPARSQESIAALQLGGLYEQDGDARAAERAYREAIALFPANIVGWERAVRVAGARRGAVAADSLLQEAPAQVREESPLLFASGVVAETRGDLLRAEAAYRAALVQAVNPAQIEARLGVVLAQLGKGTEARSALESAYSAGDRRPGTAAYLAVLRFLDGDEAGSAEVRAFLPADLATALDRWARREGAEEIYGLRPDLARAIQALTSPAASAP